MTTSRHRPPSNEQRIAETKELIERCKAADDPESRWALALLNELLEHLLTESHSQHP